MALRPIPDRGVLKEADAFRQVAQILNACPESMMSIPAIVNAAFALELYLKSLNIEWQVPDPANLGRKKSWVTRKPLQTGHAPSRLFSALDQTMQSDLEKKYGAWPRHTNSSTLAQTLAAYDDLFQDWRYLFEGRAKSVDTDGLLAVLAFFSEALNALPERWASSDK